MFSAIVFPRLVKDARFVSTAVVRHSSSSIEVCRREQPFEEDVSYWLLVDRPLYLAKLYIEISKRAGLTLHLPINLC